MRRLAVPLGSLLLVATLTGCPTVPEEDARAAIQQAFEAANPPGRLGVELKGKSVWLQAPMFQETCLHDNDLAFTDEKDKRPRGKAMRLSPTYDAQRFFTGFTEAGWCVYLGSDPRIDIREGSWEGDRWDFFTILSFSDPSPWAQCLEYGVLNRQISVVRAEDGTAKVDGSLALFEDDACQQPLPGGEERRSAVRPSTKAPSAPSLGTVQSLLTEFDQALYDRDFEKALGMVSCYNVFEEQKYGTCAVSELIMLAPLPRNGAARPEDGPPWSMNAFTSLDSLKRVFPDREDKSLYHVEIAPRKKKGAKKRSLAVQWVNGAWKIVGVVGLKAEDLTTLQIVYDLDRKEKREIFERRMQGEQIDAKGNPYDPYAEYREED